MNKLEKNWKNKIKLEISNPKLKNLIILKLFWYFLFIYNPNPVFCIIIFFFSNKKYLKLNDLHFKFDHFIITKQKLLLKINQKKRLP